MKINEMLLKIWENQEESKKDINEIKVTLAEQKIVLDEHQRRSLANEESVNILREQIKPIENHVLIMNFIFKIILYVAGAIGTVASLLKIIDFFIK